MTIAHFNSENQVTVQGQTPLRFEQPKTYAGTIY